MALKPNAPSLDALAQMCLDHFAQNPDQLAEFMVQSGLTPQSLRALVGSEGFNHGLVDYVASNEPLLLQVTAANRLKPETFMTAWARLHNGEE